MIHPLLTLDGYPDLRAIAAAIEPLPARMSGAEPNTAAPAAHG